MGYLLSLSIGGAISGKRYNRLFPSHPLRRKGFQRNSDRIRCNAMPPKAGLTLPLRHLPCL